MVPARRAKASEIAIAITTWTRSVARSASSSRPLGALETARLTPWMLIATTVLLTIETTAITVRTCPKPSVPRMRGRRICCAKPNAMNATLAPAMASPPRPAERTVSPSVGGWIAGAGVVASLTFGALSQIYREGYKGGPRAPGVRKIPGAR